MNPLYVVFGFIAWCALCIITFFLILTGFLIWTEHRKVDRLEARKADDTAFAQTQPIDIITAAEQVLKAGR